MRPWNPELPNFLFTDSSKTAAAGFLAQKCAKTNSYYVVEFFSRKFSEDQARNASSAVLELMAVVALVRHFKVQLFAKGATIFTDHLSMRFLAAYKPDRCQPRVIAMANAIRDYENLKFVHLPGKRNCLADHFSRYPPTITPMMLDLDLEPYYGIQETIPLDSFSTDALAQFDLKAKRKEINLVAQTEEFIRSLKQDPFYKELHDILIGNKKSTRSLQKQSSRYTLDLNDILWYRKSRGKSKRTLLYVPESLRRSYIGKHHDELGHSSTYYTIQRLEQKYFWTNLRQDVKAHVKSCLVCAKSSRQCGKRQGKMQFIDPGKLPLTELVVDFFGPFKTSQNSQMQHHIFAAINRFTRYVFLYHCKTTSTQEVIKCLSSIFSNYGVPERIQSDNATCFKSHEYNEFLKLKGIIPQHGSPYEPQSQGLIERRMIQISDYLTKHLPPTQQKNITSIVADAMFYLNTQVNKSLDMGHGLVTPFYALFGGFLWRNRA